MRWEPGLSRRALGGNGGLSTVALAQIVSDTSVHPYHLIEHIGRSLLSEPLPTVPPFSPPS